MSKWLCVGCTSTYGTLHGMYYISFYEGTEDEAWEIARCNSLDVIESYSWLMDDIAYNATYQLEETDENNYAELYQECLEEEIGGYIVRLRDDVDLLELEQLNYDPETYKIEFGDKSFD